MMTNVRIRVLDKEIQVVKSEFIPDHEIVHGATGGRQKRRSLQNSEGVDSALDPPSKRGVLCSSHVVVLFIL